MPTTTAHLTALAHALARVPRDTDGSALGRSRYNGDALPGYTAYIMAACGGVCVVCGTRPATDLGHIIPARNGRKGFSTGNIGGMCRPCNVAIADSDMSGKVDKFRNADGIPTDPYNARDWAHISTKQTEYDATDELRELGIL
jgi:hypothetical protein